jgi:histone H3/H4
MLEEAVPEDIMIQARAVAMFQVAVDLYMHELAKVAEQMRSHSKHKSLHEDDIRLALEVLRK